MAEVAVLAISSPSHQCGSGRDLTPPDSGRSQHRHAGHFFPPPPRSNHVLQSCATSTVHPALSRDGEVRDEAARQLKAEWLRSAINQRQAAASESEPSSTPILPRTRSHMKTDCAATPGLTPGNAATHFLAIGSLVPSRTARPAPARRRLLPLTWVLHLTFV